MQKLPAVRASALRDVIALMDKVERGAQARLYARLPEPCKTLVETTARTGWVPVEHGHHTVDGIVEIFGRERAVTFWTDAIADMAERPIFKAFLSGMLKIGVLDAARVLSIFATGWPLAYRDVCLPRVTTNAAGQPVLRFDEVTPEVRRYRNYFHSWHGACAGFMRFAGIQAAVAFQVAPDASFAEATFTLQ